MYLNTAVVMTVLTVIFIYILQYFWNRRNLYLFSRKVPGPNGLPLIGSILDFVGSSNDIFQNIMVHFNRYPEILKVWYGPYLIYGIAKPEYLEKVLTSPKALSKMFLYKYAEPSVGHGLFSAPVPTWKSHRKIIMPTFNQQVLNRFVPIFNNHIKVTTRLLEKYVDAGEFDVFDVVMKCNQDILCETAMGIKSNNQGEDSPFAYWVSRLMEIMFLRMFVVWYHYDFIFKWTQFYHDEVDLIKKLHNFTDNIIKTRKLKFRKERTNTTSFNSFLDQLLLMASSEKCGLTDREIRDEVNTFMLAGTDTTAGTISFVFLMLAMHQDVQEKAYQEVVEILGPDGNIENNDLRHFEYLERVIKETMRLFPIGAFIVRDIKEDLDLTDDLVLPKGCSVILGIMAVHRNQDIWPNAMEFDPERFTAERIAERHPYSYLPFSGGPRNCVGPKYAMMLMKTFIALIIKKYKLSTSYKKIEDIKLKTDLTLKTQDGFKISLQYR